MAPIHILIIPVRHVASLQELEDDSQGLLDHMAAIVRRLAESEHVGSSGYRLVINSGADAGQSVFHLHLHMLAGRRLRWPPG
jgi:histidine triad (HIT) family protein